MSVWFLSLSLALKLSRQLVWNYHEFLHCQAMLYLPFPCQSLSHFWWWKMFHTSNILASSEHSYLNTLCFLHQSCVPLHIWNVDVCMPKVIVLKNKNKMYLGSMSFLWPINKWRVSYSFNHILGSHLLEFT